MQLYKDGTLSLLFRWERLLRNKKKEPKFYNLLNMQTFLENLVF